MKYLALIVIIACLCLVGCKEEGCGPNGCPIDGPHSQSAQQSE